MTSIELKSFFDKEFQNFKKITLDSNIEIHKSQNFQNEQFSESTKPSLNHTNLRWDNIEKQLLIPFKNGKITTEEFLKIIKKLDHSLLAYIPQYFEKYKVDMFESDELLYNSILKLSLDFPQSKDYLIRATQRPNQSKKEIIDSLLSESFYSSKHHDVNVLLLRLASVSQESELMLILDHAIEKLPLETRLRWTVAGDGVSVFDYILSKYNEPFKSQTLKLLYKFLKKSALSAASQFDHILSEQISDEFKDLLNLKLKENFDFHEKENSQKNKVDFYENYLSHYARNFRTESIQIIDKVVTLDSSKVSLDENQINYKIKDYNDEVVVRYGIGALVCLAKLKDLSQVEKEIVLTSLKKSNLINANGYYWRDAIEILQNLYPESKYEDYEFLFKDVSQSYRYISSKDYWNRQTYSISKLDDYLNFFNSIMIDTSNIETRKLYIFKKNYRNDDRQTVIWGVLNLLGISVHYDAETGVWPNDYQELFRLYIDKSEDLKQFYSLIDHKKLDENFKTNYTAILTNGKVSYKANPKDLGDWYDSQTIEHMLNICLEDLGSKKRFIQINTGDQTILSIYAEPGQVKKISEMFHFKIVNEY